MTLFPPQGKPLNFENITNMTVEHGVLTFSAKKDQRSPESQKIVTNLPFMCMENVGRTPAGGTTS
ncbi:MAG: hypothetical protein WB952_00310 [Terriglobales bacterium]